MVYLFLANGFEEVEALTPLDMLRRADIPVVTVGVGSNIPCGAHNICVKTDCTEADVDISKMSAVILPGGMPGTLNLEKSEIVQTALSYAINNDLPIAAICAAPSILGNAGYLTGRKAVCYPGFEDRLAGAEITSEAVVIDGNIITAKGAGVALDFAFALIAVLHSKEKADEIRSAIQCR